MPYFRHVRHHTAIITRSLDGAKIVPNLIRSIKKIRNFLIFNYLQLSIYRIFMDNLENLFNRFLIQTKIHTFINMIG